MRKIAAAAALPLALIVTLAPSAQAAGRDEHINFPIADVLNNPEFKATLPAGVRD